MRIESNLAYPNFTLTEPQYLPRLLAYEDGSIKITDTVWPECRIGTSSPRDRVFGELVHNPLVRRSQAIEQLTLDPEVSTIPNTGYFSRWEHIWGSVAFVRNILDRGSDLTAEQQRDLQLRTFVSDLGHTAFSHLGDWMFQGSGGPEDQHDVELAKIMEASGVSAVLRRHDIDPDAVTFPDETDWIECKSPDLCVDRVDYGSREIRRWLNVDTSVQAATQAKAFALHGDELVMTSQEAAVTFGKAFLLLATEHWSEPVHRLQLRLQEELVKDVLATDMAHLISISPTDIGSYHPRDLMYTIDADITRETYRFGMFRRMVRPLMMQIGENKRRVFVEQRRSQLAHFLLKDTAEFPNPTEPYGRYKDRFGDVPLQPSNVSIIPVDSTSDVSDFGSRTDAVDFYLTPLKARAVDPPFRTDNGEIIRASEADPKFARLREQQTALLAQPYVARIHMNARSAATLHGQLREIAGAWQEALQRPRMPKDVFQRVLYNSATFAAPSRMVNFYPDAPLDDEQDY